MQSTVAAAEAGLENRFDASLTRLTNILLKSWASAAMLAALAIAVLEMRAGVYREMTARIWENHPYPPGVILATLKETEQVSPLWACATGVPVERATFALRVLDDAMAGRSDLSLPAALQKATEAVDDGLACRPLASELWLGRFWVRALGEGFRPPLRASYDRSIATAPYDGWMMRLRTQIGSRWFFALDDNERRKFFEDLRYTVDMGFLDDAYMAAQRLANQPDLLRAEINQWPLGTRNRLAQFLLSKGLDLKLSTDFELKPWQHY